MALCDDLSYVHVEWVSQKNCLRSWFRGTDETHAPIKYEGL